MLSIARLCFLLACGLLAACTRQIQVQPDDAYLRLAPPGTFAPVKDSERLQPFVRLFSDLSKPAVETQIATVYAEQLYFNDTFHTFTQREQIRNYFMSMAEHATTEVTALDYSEHGNDVWLRWTMRTRFSVLWRDLDITTLGVTHLRFNAAGLIELHQDYWDGVEGFYAHLPVVGGLITHIRSGLGN